MHEKPNNLSLEPNNYHFFSFEGKSLLYVGKKRYKEQKGRKLVKK